MRESRHPASVDTIRMIYLEGKVISGSLKVQDVPVARVPFTRSCVVDHGRPAFHSQAAVNALHAEQARSGLSPSAYL
jgi:hypothetical protein